MAAPSGGRIEAIVLVGGFGTRLRPVVDDRPKPLATVAGRPFLEWVLLDLARQGVRTVVLAAGYGAEQVRAAIGDGARYGVEVRYSVEEQPLGTGGAVRLALDHTSAADVLVVNGDSYCDYDLPVLWEKHRSAGARITLWVTDTDDPARFGSVEVAAGGEVAAIREKDSAASSRTINAGVYLFQRAVLAELRPSQRVALETEVFPRWVGRGLYAVRGRSPLIDIGTPESYASATEALGPALRRLRVALRDDR